MIDVRCINYKFTVTTNAFVLQRAVFVAWCVRGLNETNAEMISKKISVVIQYT